MGLIYATRRKIRLFYKKFKNSLVKIVVPVYWKELNELKFWKKLRNIKDGFSNGHYEHFFTKHFDKEISYYNDKVLLDIGCGPLGSLEWAFNAKRRIGLDPLADEYLKLGATEHQMEYMNASSEKIPLNNDACDVVFSFNSLDHVDNIEKTIKEIKRVVRPNGFFLLIVEVNHRPTDCEPHTLTAKGLIESLAPEFTYESLKAYKAIHKGMYASIRENCVYADSLNNEEVAFLSAIFKRK
jgi:ubiquinone/menaquinone biosynthesis C-methylase UbiE